MAQTLKCEVLVFSWYANDIASIGHIIITLLVYNRVAKCDITLYDLHTAM